LFRQALELEPAQPNLLHNLIASLALQDRHAEALIIVNRLFQEHPDYLFARTALARHAMQVDDLQRAADLLEPLFERRKFHFSEFDSLCSTQIELLLRQGDLLSARTWYKMWEDSNPQNPKLKQFRRFFPERY
jgi:tetratricopeptide (TPR) repeat protein